MEARAGCEGRDGGGESVRARSAGAVSDLVADVDSRPGFVRGLPPALCVCVCLCVAWPPVHFAAGLEVAAGIAAAARGAHTA